MKEFVLFLISRKIELDWWSISRNEKKIEKMIESDIPLKDIRYKRIASRLYNKKKEARDFAYYYEMIAGLRTRTVSYI